MSETFDEASLVFTDAAAAKVKGLIEEEQNDNLKLRVFITGGGCAGFSYGFTFDEQKADDECFPVIAREASAVAPLGKLDSSSGQWDLGPLVERCGPRSRRLLPRM